METNELIRMRRIELGMTMKDLAKRVGVCPRRPSADGKAEI